LPVPTTPLKHAALTEPLAVRCTHHHVVRARNALLVTVGTDRFLSVAA